MIRKTNSQKLKELRGEMSQRELSELLKIGLSRIKGLETGRIELKGHDLEAYVNRLKIKEEDLFIYEKRKSNLIAISSIKGGAGKTSISANLSFSLAEKGKKVLMIDTDSQMNLVQHYGILNTVIMNGEEVEEFIDPEKNLYRAFNENISVLDMIKETGRENLDIIVSDPQLAFMDSELSNKPFGPDILSDMIREIKNCGLYDFVIFDTSINLATFNTTILKNMDCILIPIIPSSFGIYGMERLINHVDQIERYASSGRRIIRKIIINQVDQRKIITKDVEKFLDVAYKDLVMKSTIRTDSNIDNCQWESKALGEFKPKSKAQQDFSRLANELIKMFNDGGDE